MKHRAVLFDLDGTLLDSLEDLGDSVNRVLAPRGFPTHRTDACRNFIGDGARMLVRRALPEIARTDALIDTCLAEFRLEYAERWNVKSHLYEGVAEMLDALTTEDLKLAILSNKPHDFTQRCVLHYLSRWPFDVVFGMRPGVAAKPDPAGALEVADSLQIPPAEILYVGDSGVDMRTAVAAGMPAIGVTWGFRPAEELSQSGAQVLLDHPMDLLGLL